MKWWKRLLCLINGHYYEYNWNYTKIKCIKCEDGWKVNLNPFKG